MKKKKKPIIVAVCGPFDPLHVGHIEYLQKARKLGDKLVVALNNDNWLKMKKGYSFMNEQDRKKLLLALECVDAVRISKHKPKTKDSSSIEGLMAIKPDIFAKGGDRTSKNVPEVEYCKKAGIKTVFGLGKKIRSSSDMVADAVKHYKKIDQKKKRAQFKKNNYRSKGLLALNKEK